MQPRTVYILIGCGQIAVWYAFSIWPELAFEIGELVAGALSIWWFVRVMNRLHDPRHAKWPAEDS
jgi:hypothetical protein